MTGMLQVLGDVKTLVATDRRVWLAAGFLCSCAFIYLITGSWREPYVEEVPVEWKRVRIPQTNFNDRINKLNADMEASRKERAELKLRLQRASNEIQAQTDEIDWQVDRLIDSLDSMSNKVDGMVNRVGAHLLREKELERVSNAAGRKKK